MNGWYALTSLSGAEFITSPPPPAESQHADDPTGRQVAPHYSTSLHRQRILAPRLGESMTDPQVSGDGARWREFHPFGRRCPRRTCPGEACPASSGWSRGRRVARSASGGAKWRDHNLIGVPRFSEVT